MRNAWALMKFMSESSKTCLPYYPEWLSVEQLDDCTFSTNPMTFLLYNGSLLAPSASEDAHLELHEVTAASTPSTSLHYCYRRASITVRHSRSSSSIITHHDGTNYRTDDYYS